MLNASNHTVDRAMQQHMKYDHPIWEYACVFADKEVGKASGHGSNTSLLMLGNFVVEIYSISAVSPTTPFFI